MNLLHEVLNPSEPLPLIFGPVKLKPFIDTRHKNIEIARVYTRIVSDIRSLLSKMNYTDHRTYLLTSYEVSDKY
jgi:hypothetical protein